MIWDTAVHVQLIRSSIIMIQVTYNTVQSFTAAPNSPRSHIFQSEAAVTTYLSYPEIRPFLSTIVQVNHDRWVTGLLANR